MCTYRLPRGESIAWPGSHCPHCQTPLAWYDNIPLLSYAILSGRCRSCGAPISPLYPALEAGNALLWTVTAYFLRSESLAATCLLLLFTSALLLVATIDLRTMQIPDTVSLFIALSGLVHLFLMPSAFWRSALLGSVLGGGILLALSWGASLWLKQPALGGGDIKMMAACGLWLGWRSTLVALCLSPYLALAALGIAWLGGKRYQLKAMIPFGPALAAASWLALLWSYR